MGRTNWVYTGWITAKTMPQNSCADPAATVADPWMPQRSTSAITSTKMPHSPLSSVNSSSIKSPEERSAWCTWPNPTEISKAKNFLNIERPCWCWSEGKKEQNKKKIPTTRIHSFDCLTVISYFFAYFLPPPMSIPAEYSSAMPQALGRIVLNSPKEENPNLSMTGTAPSLICLFLLQFYNPVDILQLTD